MSRMKKILQFINIIMLIISILFAIFLFKGMYKDIKNIIPINMNDIKRILL